VIAATGTVDVEPYEAVLERLPTRDDIKKTVDLADEKPGKANRRILGGYFELSHALGRLLHGDAPGNMPENATFATFAAWVTESLRPDVLRSVDGSADGASAPPGSLWPTRRMYTRVSRRLLGGDDRIGRNIVRGEAAVYEEIATATHMLVKHALEAITDEHRRLSDAEWSTAWDTFSANLAGTPESISEHRPADALEARDVHELQRALQPYFEVLSKGLSGQFVSAEQRRDRAQLILLANVRVLAYEQRRVQPVVRRNLAFVPDAVRARYGRELMGRNRLSDRLLRNVVEKTTPIQEALETAFQIAATRGAYSIVVGTEELRFGRDLPMPPPANPVLREHQPEQDRRRYAPGAFFPYDLENLELRPAWAAFHLHDRSSGEGVHTAVDNWLRYGERMSFLVNLFRSRQQVSALYDPPRSTPSLAIARRPVRLSSATPSPEPRG
jgi:hypothetical protein